MTASAPIARVVPTLTEVLEEAALQVLERPKDDSRQLERVAECDIGLELATSPDPRAQLKLEVLSIVDAAVDEFRLQLLARIDLMLSKPRAVRSE